jgi:hypothetical protein
MDDGKSKKKPKSLKGRMSCSRSDCNSGLHCFRVTQRKGAQAKTQGSCQSCGADQLVDWSRVHLRDLSDLEYTLTSLKQEWIRHHYWCEVNMDPKAVIHARKKGGVGMREAAEKRILQSIGKAENFREGFQTPWKGDRAVYYAQHATGTCCRRCIEYWHGIEFGRDLTNDEIAYLASLVFHYIEEKIELTESGETAAEIRQKSPDLFMKAGE